MGCCGSGAASSGHASRSRIPDLRKSIIVQYFYPSALETNDAQLFEFSQCEAHGLPCGCGRICPSQQNGRHAGVDAQTKEVIAFVVGVMNQCDFCINAHAMKLKKRFGFDDEGVAEILSATAIWSEINRSNIGARVTWPKD